MQPSVTIVFHFFVNMFEFHAFYYSNSIQSAITFVSVDMTLWKAYIRRRIDPARLN